MPLITVVMPAYNSSLFIEQAILSVLKQTYTKFELIVCDDSSTDNTMDIIERFSQLDPRVRVIKNIFFKGAAGARNSCLEMAKGEYICFLDSDDYWCENKLEIQLKFMLENNLDFCHTDYCMFIEDRAKVIKARNVINFDSLTYTCDIGCLTVMLRKSIIGVTRFPNLPKEDYAFWLLILKRGITAKKLNEVTAYYRKHKSSLSSNKIKEIYRQYYVLSKVTKYNLAKILIRLFAYICVALAKHKM
ncbi:TPA: glycosyltransferase family 2 protein [Escherichia coli]|nr:glycosyltransferase family 2 protein [Escherichia coli]HBV8813564.1 glycosyltransferase family 2 protein [Escherichia coli]